MQQNRVLCVCLCSDPLCSAEPSGENPQVGSRASASRTEPEEVLSGEPSQGENSRERTTQEQGLSQTQETG